MEEQKELFSVTDQKVETTSSQHPAASELMKLICDSLDSLLSLLKSLPTTAEVLML